jgi:hypothetical protein
MRAPGMPKMPIGSTMPLMVPVSTRYVKTPCRGKAGGDVDAYVTGYLCRMDGRGMDGGEKILQHPQ